MSDQLIARPLPKPFGREMADNFAQSPPWGLRFFTTRVKELKVPPGGLVPSNFPSLKIRRPPPGSNPRRSSHEVGTLPLDYGGRWRIVFLVKSDRRLKLTTYLHLELRLSMHGATPPLPCTWCLIKHRYFTFPIAY
jgi:hypothetical protein